MQANGRCIHGYLATAPRCPYGCVLGVKGVRRPARIEGREHRSGKRHSGYIDMTGKTCGTWIVLAEAPQLSVNGTTRWRAQHSCGATWILDGIQLRSKPPQYCANCRPKRSQHPGAIRSLERREAARSEKPAVVAVASAPLAFEEEHLT